MTQRCRKLRPWLLGVVFTGWLSGLSATEPGQFQSVGGIDVYLGVMPAEIVRGHRRAHPEQAMHGGVPAGRHVHHIVVAVFDHATGGRIADANVTATVSGLGLAGPTRSLDPMVIAGTVTYGNYFDLPGSDTYRVAVEISRPGAAAPIRTEFTYDHRQR